MWWMRYPTAGLVFFAACLLACGSSPPTGTDAGEPDATLDLVALDDCKDNEVAIPGGGCKRIGVETCAIDGVPGIKGPKSNWACVRVGVQECTASGGGRGIKGPPSWTCQPIGPPTTCLTGWAKVAGGWCEPTLPTVKCTDDKREVIGQTDCQPVGDCGSGTYGALTLTANTLHVDQATTASGADGSQAKPFPTIGEALYAAAAGAQIAVAAGTYKEDLKIIKKKKVSLRGRCAKFVTVEGQNQTEGAAAVTIAANGVEISGLTITGPSRGIGVIGATGVMVEGARVIRCAAQGIVVQGAGQVTLTNLLISDNVGGGVIALGASAKLVGCTVRGTRPWPKLVPLSLDDVKSASVAVGGVAVGGASSTLAVEKSVVLDNRDLGLVVVSSKLTLSQSVVKKTRVAPLHLPRGPCVQALGDGARALAELEVRDSIVAENRGAAIFGRGATVTIERSVVRSALPTISGPDKGSGPGVLATTFKGSPSTLTVKRSLIRDNQGSNIMVLGSTALVEQSILEAANPAAWHGEGLFATYQEGEASATVRETLVSDNVGAGVSFLHAKGKVERSVIRDTRPGKGVWGCGIMGGVWLQRMPWPRSDITITDCTVKDNHMAGLWSTDSALTVSGTLIEGTKPGLGNSVIGPTKLTFGYGVQLNSYHAAGLAQLDMQDSIVRENSGQGITAYAAKATIERTVIRDTVAIGDYQPGIGILATHAGRRTLGVQPLTVSDSLVERARYVGIAVYHTETFVERTIVRDTQAQTFDGGSSLGLGIFVGPAPGPLSSLVRARLELEDSALIDNNSTGLHIRSADAIVLRSRIEDTHAVKGAWGDGVAATSDGVFSPADLKLYQSQVIDSDRAGVLFHGSGGTVERCEISGGQFSILLEGGAAPAIGPHNLFQDNVEDGITSDQTASIPEVPQPPPRPL